MKATIILMSSVLLWGALTSAREPVSGRAKNGAREAGIAQRFAPIFYQALGDKPRSDYITNFDFDGDWRGDNNWDHIDQFPLKAYIYYSVTETSSHYFIHYTVFHPRDYKGGEVKGTILSELIREAAKKGRQYDPTGLSGEAALAHENDMEGCLLVVTKVGDGKGRLTFVETLHHNTFSHYVVGEAAEGFTAVQAEDEHPLLYIEPKGHGIEAYDGDQKQTGKKEFLRYVFRGKAEDPSANEKLICRDLPSTPCRQSVGYELQPISTTLWPRAVALPNETYGEDYDYGEIKLSISLGGAKASEKTIKVGKVACAFLGKVGGHNMARPPWGWFDNNERDLTMGRWFFDPAVVVKRHYQLGESFSTAYLSLPFWAVSPLSAGQ
ncbi:MAG TPA: hypothetical protein VKB46_22845 [Pyrinomonadaceae bacterium]|nr:hypothetical protein [Pyrinomonadaceae bacterium]